MMRTVTRDGWSVSASVPARDGTGAIVAGAELSVFRVRSERPYTVQYGDVHGRRYDSSDDAFTDALARGYLAPFVAPYCTVHRVRHMFLGKRTGYCAG